MANLPITAGRLADCVGGERVTVLEKEDGFVSKTLTGSGVLTHATLVSVFAAKGVCFLGWRDGELAVSKAWDRTGYNFENWFGKGGPGILPPPADFVKFSCVALITECYRTPGATFAGTSKDGVVCRRCRSRNEYAAPNRPDGSYVCFECRT